MFKDIGKFAGRYFQALGCLYIAWAISEPIFCDSLNIDLSFLFLFWAAHYLIQHHPAARKWTIGVCGFLLAGLVAHFIHAAIAGTQGMFVILLGKRIEHPSLWQEAASVSESAVFVGLPLILLLTPQARREFQRSAEVDMNISSSAPEEGKRKSEAIQPSRRAGSPRLGEDGGFFSPRSPT